MLGSWFESNCLLTPLPVLVGLVSAEPAAERPKPIPHED
jgi:hypothetical protein